MSADKAQRVHISSAKARRAYLEHDPGYLEQHKVKVFLLQNVRILAAEVISGTGAPGLSLGLVRVRASSEICEL